jgi:cytochrome c553
MMTAMYSLSGWGGRLAVFLSAGAVAVSLAGPVRAGDPVAGREKANKCKTCHGLDGIARLPQAPNLAGESTIYLEKQLKAFRDGTRQNEMMSIIAKDLSDEDIADLAAWYESLKITVEMPD